jgi:hypothetical protein
VEFAGVADIERQREMPAAGILSKTVYAQFFSLSKVLHQKDVTT